MFSNVNALIKVKAFTPSPIYLIGNHQQAFLLDSVSNPLFLTINGCYIQNLTLSANVNSCFVVL